MQFLNLWKVWQLKHQTKKDHIQEIQTVTVTTFGNGRGGFHDDDNKKNFVFICLNINNQQIINPPTPPLTGVLDLVTANYLSDDVSILLRYWWWYISPTQPTIPSESGPYSVAVGDLDNDGNLDLATAVWNSNSVSILLGKGDGTFGQCNFV